MSKKYDLAVTIGRFQPVHNGHVTVFTRAAEIANNVLVLVGSSYIARNIKNPFSFEERKKMLSDVLTDHLPKDVGFEIQPIVDNPYADHEWMAQVQGRVDQALENIDESKKKKQSVVLVGYHKDVSSYYLDMFQWDKYEAEGFSVERGIVSSTDIRDLFFTSDGSQGPSISEHVPTSIQQGLRTWFNSSTFSNLRDEYYFLQKYRQQFVGLPYPPTFVTVDAVVICNGHVLLVKRRAQPSKGSWALPGGFLGNERIVDGIVRELQEETRIKVPASILKSSMKLVSAFDHPNRSLRGRTITHAGLIVLSGNTLPAVRGSDDAERAKWTPINKFWNMSEEMFEDHYHVVNKMITINTW